MSEESEWVSKTQKKREADAVSDLVAQLLTLKPKELAQIALPEVAVQGLADAKKINQNVARKRHLKWLSKQLRAEDLTAIEQALDAVMEERKGDSAASFDRTMADTLADEDNQALSEFISQYHPDNIQQLRQLIRQAKKEFANQQNLGGSRSLFRFLKAVMS